MLFRSTCIIAFYFLLRSCEYTEAPETNRRQTKPFRWRDVQLWQNLIRLPIDLPFWELQQRCTSITLCIENQKTGRKHTPINHHRLPRNHESAELCPILAILRRLRNSRANPNFLNEVITTYNDTTGSHTIRATTITKALKAAVTALNLQAIGVYPTQVSTHSLRLGGATAMFLNGVDEITIKKMGRWSSDTFLIYIQEQLSLFSKGISEKMSKPFNFHITRTPIAPRILLGPKV